VQVLRRCIYAGCSCACAFAGAKVKRCRYGGGAEVRKRCRGVAEEVQRYQEAGAGAVQVQRCRYRGAEIKQR
jgi:hypothetical protein